MQINKIKKFIQHIKNLTENNDEHIIIIVLIGFDENIFIIYLHVAKPILWQSNYAPIINNEIGKKKNHHFHLNEQRKTKKSMILLKRDILHIFWQLCETQFGKIVQ